MLLHHFDDLVLLLGTANGSCSYKNNQIYDNSDNKPQLETKQGLYTNQSHIFLFQKSKSVDSPLESQNLYIIGIDSHC